ncbi:hypothetical protein BaRGS_00000184 [Batillaria attramentaria]|uniref:Uncharacterized protein n=1 Tax=Batillaria attramentaria TaxID=370345 RepID=A0ABD0MB99_9CAEN
MSQHLFVGYGLTPETNSYAKRLRRSVYVYLVSDTIPCRCDLTRRGRAMCTRADTPLYWVQTWLWTWTELTDNRKAKYKQYTARSHCQPKSPSPTSQPAKLTPDEISHPPDQSTG